MQISVRELIDFDKLKNHEVIQLISDLTSKMAYFEDLPEKRDEEVKFVLYNFLENYEN